MKYIVKLIDDNGEELMAEETQLGEVAEKYLHQARMIEKAIPDVTADFVRSTMTQYCDQCGAVLTTATLSTDIDGNRAEKGLICSHCN